MIKFGNTFVNFGGAYLTGHTKYDPYNPLGLLENTIRVKFLSGFGYTPTMGDTQILVNAEENIWDIYKESNDWTGLFRDCAYLSLVLGANTSNVTKMVNLFRGCSSLTSVPLFDTSKVTNMNWMFAGSNLTSVPLFDTSKVTNMSYMFSDCNSLAAVPLFDTSNVTDMTYMLYNCKALNEIPLFDTSKVTNMSYMFAGSNLTSVPLLDTSKVTNMYWMFSGCYKLHFVPLLDTSKVTNMSYMFRACFYVRSGALALYQQASSQTTPPISHTQTFYECGISTDTGRAEWEQIPAGWK